MDERLDGILVSARSIGGVATTISFPELDVTVDLGVCTQAALRTSTILFTHTHADHLGGLPTYLGVRRLLGMRAPRLVVPRPMVEPLTNLLSSLSVLQGRPFEAHILGASLGEDLQLTKQLFVHPFAVNHSIPSLGYVIFRRTKKLRPKFKRLPAAEIVALRPTHEEEMFYLHDEPLVAVTGDTMAQGLDVGDPLVRTARILFIESTFLDDRRDLEHVHAGGHARLDELFDLIKQLKCRTVVLYHFSQTYRTAEIENILKESFATFSTPKVRWLLPADEHRL